MIDEARNTANLAEAREITNQIRRLQNEIVDLAARRRRILRALWVDGAMTQREIADAVGVCGQTVWNEIHRES